MSGYIKKEKEKRKRKTGFKNILSNFLSHSSEEYLLNFELHRYTSKQSHHHK